jgi:hypothetical protein
VRALSALEAVCFLWPDPSPCGAQALPGSLPDGARTFLGLVAQPATIASSLYLEDTLRMGNRLIPDGRCPDDYAYPCPVSPASRAFTRSTKSSRTESASSHCASAC